MGDKVRDALVEDLRRSPASREALAGSQEYDPHLLAAAALPQAAGKPANIRGARLGHQQGGMGACWATGVPAGRHVCLLGRMNA